MMGELVGQIRLVHRKNADKSFTFYFRWSTREEGGLLIPHMERYGRTGPNPTKRQVNRWRDEARVAIVRLRQETGGVYHGRDGELVNMGIEAGVTIYLTWLAGDKTHEPPVAASTARAVERVLGSFQAHVAEGWPKHRHVNQITSQQTASWVRMRQGRGLKPATLRAQASLLKSFLDFAWEHGWRADPIRMAKIQVPRGLNDVPSRDAVLRAIEAGPDEIARAAIHTLAATGMRQGELKGLPTNAWRLEDGLLVIPQGKRERTKLHGRTLPIGPSVGGVLTGVQDFQIQWGNGQLFAWHHRPMTSQLNRWLRPVGLVPHALRRWFIATLHRLECPSYIVQDLAGHARSHRDRAYDPMGTPPEQMRPWMERVGRLLGLDD